jgi:membrane-associated phospholipid phosphatase
MLSYGNPSRNILPYLKTESYLDNLLGELASYPFPSNNGQDVIDEITQLINYTNTLSSDEIIQKRYKIYDENFEGYFINVMSNAGADRDDVTNTINEIKKDIYGFIIKLKYHYQRVRPIQLSHILSMRLYPFDSVTADTPSYPSGHSIQSKVYAEVLGNKYPKFYNKLQELAADIYQSRLAMGIHYPSDCLFGEYVTELILKHPEFKKKYRL